MDEQQQGEEVYGGMVAVTVTMVATVGFTVGFVFGYLVA